MRVVTKQELIEMLVYGEVVVCRVDSLGRSIRPTPEQQLEDVNIVREMTDRERDSMIAANQYLNRFETWDREEVVVK